MTQPAQSFAAPTMGGPEYFERPANEAVEPTTFNVLPQSSKLRRGSLPTR